MSGAAVGLGRPVQADTRRRRSPLPASVPQAPPPRPADELRASLRRLLTTLLERGFGIALDAVERMAANMDEIAAHRGVQVSAVLGGISAKVGGRSPLIGALKGALSALHPTVRVALIVALVLGLLLLPVTVVLLLLALIVLAIVLSVRAARS